MGDDGRKDLLQLLFVFILTSALKYAHRSTTHDTQQIIPL